MNMENVVEIAILAFGPRWKRALSQRCGISREQLWRYEKGLVRLHDVAAAKIRIALRTHLELKRDQIARKIAWLDGVQHCE
jgi:hypothetical protein